MNKDTKEQLKQTLKDIENNHPIVETFCEFLDTYDGNNHDETNTMALSLILFMMEFKQIEEKSIGFNQLLQESQKTVEDIKELSIEYAKLTKKSDQEQTENNEEDVIIPNTD